MLSRGTLTEVASQNNIQLIQDEVANEVAALVAKRDAIRADILKGVANAKQSIKEIEDLNEFLTRMTSVSHKLESVLSSTSGAQSDAITQSHLHSISRMVTLVYLLSIAIALIATIPLSQLASWIFSTLPAPIQSLLNVILALVAGVFALVFVAGILLFLYDVVTDALDKINGPRGR